MLTEEVGSDDQNIREMTYFSWGSLSSPHSHKQFITLFIYSEDTYLAECIVSLSDVTKYYKYMMMN